MTESSSDLAAAQEYIAELEQESAQLRAAYAKLAVERDAALAVITAGCQIAQAVAPVIQEYATAVDRFMKDQT